MKIAFSLVELPPTNPTETQHSKWSKITKEIAIAPVTSLSDSNLIFLLAEFESLAVVIVEVRGMKRVGSWTCYEIP